jgi:hypothetical protein
MGSSDAILGTLQMGRRRGAAGRGLPDQGACAGYAEPLRPGNPDQEHSVTLNDAVASDNFTVLHAKISKPFRDQFPPDKLRSVFKDLVEKHAVFDAIVASPVIPDEDAKIDDKGVLRLKGHFDTAPKKVKYQLGFIPSDGQWKLSGISIDIE